MLWPQSLFAPIDEMFFHPFQFLADLITIREYKGTFDGLKLCFVGDGNNMANSLIVGCLKVGMSVAIACPNNHRPDETVLEFAKKYKDKCLITDDIRLAAKGADVLYTDVWASMGQEGEAELRKKEFKDFQINQELLDVANDGCMVLHCLPAHRGEEITDDVIESHLEIFDEAENRLHAQKAVLVKLLK